MVVYNECGEAIDISDMDTPVRCMKCGAVYDLSTITVTQRYADCSLWKTPCCQRLADDREWKSLADYRRIEKRPVSPFRDVISYDMFGTVLP